MLEGVAVDAAHHPGVQIIDPVQDPQGFGGDEVAGGDGDAHPGHGGVGQAQGEEGLDLDPQAARGLLDAGQGLGVGDAQALDIAKAGAAPRQAGLDLRPGAVDQDQADAQAMEGGQVVYQVAKTLVRHRLAPKGDDEGAPAMGVDIGGGVAEPAHETIGGGLRIRTLRQGVQGVGRSSHSMPSLAKR